ncbi:MAG: hypothetical protein ACMXYB_02785 [Candidatus Woesearchaeota archaeon]
MNSLNLKYVILLFAFLSSLSKGFSNSPILFEIEIIFQTLTSATPGVYQAISFLLITIFFFVLFKQGTIRMLPNNSRGAKAVALVMAIFASVGLLSHERLINANNALATIGSSILFPVLIIALFAGSWAILRGINSARVSGFGRVLMYLGFGVVFITVFLAILSFGASTLFDAILETQFFQSLVSFLTGLLIFIGVIFVIVLIFVFFTVREFLELFDSSDDESVLARARKKKKEKKEKEANVVEQLNQLKKAFSKMRTAYDEKGDILRDISRIDDIESTLDKASEVPPQDPDRRALYRNPENFGGPFR